MILWVFKFSGTLEVCDSCARSKAKACAVRNNTYTRASNPGENCFVDTTVFSLENALLMHTAVIT